MNRQTLADFSATVASLFAMVPAGAIASAILVLAVIAALFAYRIAASVLRRTLAGPRPLFYSVVRQLQHPLRLALILLALNIAVPLAPIEPTFGAYLAGTLQVGFIAMLGLIALATLNIVSELYLRRFDIDVADNLLARKQVTQVRVLKGAVGVMIVIVTIAAALMSFEQVRQYGVSLLASAGVAGIVAGFAARPVLSNLIAGVQLAITQPIRIDDAVIVEGEWGRVEEITMTYVVVRIWDLRRLIVPLSYFIERPFQNWTRETATLIGVVTLRVDFTVPVDEVRAKAQEFVRASKLWDGHVFNVQVTDADHYAMELRVLASAANSGAAWDLRCYVREKLIGFLQREYPNALPHRRQEIVSHPAAGADRRPPAETTAETAARSPEGPSADSSDSPVSSSRSAANVFAEDAPAGAATSRGDRR